MNEAYPENCLFCRIIQKKIPATVIFENSTAIAFEDINPQAPVHILIVPKNHLDDIHSMKDEDAINIGRLFLVAQSIARDKGLEKKGYRLIINNGRDAGQTVFHVHLHLLSGRPFSWPPG